MAPKTIILIFLLQLSFISARPEDPPEYQPGRLSLPEGGELAYAVRPGSGPALVLIPGSWGDRHVFDRLIPALDDSLHLVIVELRGQGESWPPVMNGSIESFAKDVLLVTDSLGLNHFYTAGHSIGGMIAIQLAALRPESVCGVISIEGWTHHQVEKAAFGRVKTTTMSPEEEERQLAQRKRGQGRLTDQQIAAFAAIWRKWDGLPILESTSVPILELWGDRGHPRPDRPTMRIPERRNIQLQWIRNASHYLLIEEPRQVGKLINEFIPEAGCRKKSSDPSRMLAVPEIKINKESADFKGLPRLPHRSATIYRGVEHESGFNMHPYLTFHSGKFYAMWSSNRIRDLQAGQHVLYSTSENGRDWAEPAMLTPREEEKGMRYFARGFWQREGELIALAAYDEAVRPLFGPGLELRGYIWSDEKETWSGPILVADDTINNFPPKQLSTGEWMMSRRNHSMDKSMLAGGVESPGEWREIPVPEPEDGSQLDEPFWWILPNGSLTAVFRDGSRSRRLYRSFSRDDGQTWTPPIRTDFPDATAKFNVLRLSNGVYAMASNPNPSGKRVPLCLSLSDDGISFNRMFILRDAPTIYRYAGKDPGYAGYHYPQLLEHEGFLYLIHSENMEDIVLLRIRLEDLSGK